MLITNRQALSDGIRDGIPIGLGYFVVSFTLGITAKHAGLNPLQGFITSLLNNASAGEYAGFIVIAADAPYLEIAAITLVANARYLLMSAVMSQKFSPDTPFYHRIFVGFDVTDEIFGITVARHSIITAHLFLHCPAGRLVQFLVSLQVIFYRLKLSAHYLSHCMECFWQ